MDRCCIHLKKRSKAEQLRDAHVAVSLKASPIHSRSELDETTYLCAICSAFLIVRLQELEEGR